MAGDELHLYLIELWLMLMYHGQGLPERIVVEFEGHNRTQACAAARRAHPGYEVGSCNMIG